RQPIQETFLGLVDPLARFRYWPRIIPPRRLRRSGKDIAGYVRGGNWMLEKCQKWGSLNPSSHILDVGCGDGRFAAALARFLKNGSYSSFEVNGGFVSYLRRRFGKRRPSFSFTHANLWHSYYNPSGKVQAAEYRFPYAENQFDLVFLNSILSHQFDDVM